MLYDVYFSSDVKWKKLRWLIYIENFSELYPFLNITTEFEVHEEYISKASKNHSVDKKILKKYAS